MPDGSEPSKFAAVAAPKTPFAPEQPEAIPSSQVRSEPSNRRGFSLSGLFRRRAAETEITQISDGNGNGRDLSASEKAMIDRVVSLEGIRVGDVAIPRADINAVEMETPLRELLTCFADAGHSRLPVYRSDLDDPLGFVHIKDVVDIIAKDGWSDDDQPIAGIVRKLLFAPPSMPVAELLLRMQAQQIHMALVIDEFGGTDGLVTIEDVIEEIVGDIRDEHDEAEQMGLRQTQGGRWDADARIELQTLAEQLDRDLRLPDEEADTLGGLVFSLAGRVPLRGEVIPHPDGHEFEIAEADPRVVRRVLIKLATAQSSDEGDSAL
ncbi:MAG: hemolysin family protein [Pseudomonadota bacterium]